MNCFRTQCRTCKMFCLITQTPWVLCSRNLDWWRAWWRAADSLFFLQKLSGRKSGTHKIDCCNLVPGQRAVSRSRWLPLKLTTSQTLQQRRIEFANMLANFNSDLTLLLHPQWSHCSHIHFHIGIFLIASVRDRTHNSTCSTAMKCTSATTGLATTPRTTISGSRPRHLSWKSKSMKFQFQQQNLGSLLNSQT